MTSEQAFIHKQRINKQGAFLYRWRRHEDWTENYTLYRDKVQLNRLLQRQSVNIPLIKYSIKTLLKDIDDAPMLYFSNLDNDDQAEVFYNEYWKFVSRENKTIVKDIVDKRQVLLFGRSFKMLNIVNGMFNWEVVDPQDILVDRYVDPANIDSARFIIREHIYKPLSSLTTNPLYNTAAVKRLQDFYKSDEGLKRTESNQLDWAEKNKRMMAMGLIDAMNPTLGETYVELNEHFIFEYNPKTGRDELQFAVTAEDMEVLVKKPLEEVIGKTREDYWTNHYPLTTWGDETERTDFWSDSVADTLRTPNKVLNAWFSQMVENRTLRNFGMTYYNSSMGEEGFTPQTFDPVPFGWYPIPAGEDGKISDKIMRVDIPDLTDNLEQMNFLLGVAEKASAATSFQQGEQAQNQVTLGEVKLLLANAQERVKSMAIYYTDSWKDFGIKYCKLLEAAGAMIDPQTIHRHGRLTKKMYTRTISPKDWETKMGYAVEVQMQSEKQQEDMDSLQWLNAARQTMAGNQVVDTIYKKKLLENGHLSSEEVAEALKLDEQMMKAAAMQPQPTMPQTRPPITSINFKDLPAQGQPQLAQQAGIELNQAPAQPGAMQQPQGTPPAQPSPMPQMMGGVH